MAHRAEVYQLSALVPASVEYDEDQAAQFGSPEELEQEFEAQTGASEIGEDYAVQLERLFRAIARRARSRQVQFLDRWTDTVRIVMYFYEHELRLHIVAVRPCCEGRGFFSAIMRRLLSTACEVNKPLVVSGCFPKTLAMLRRAFDGVMTIEARDGAYHPSCYFTDLQRVREWLLRAA